MRRFRAPLGLFLGVLLGLACQRSSTGNAAGNAPPVGSTAGAEPIAPAPYAPTPIAPAPVAPLGGGDASPVQPSEPAPPAAPGGLAASMLDAMNRVRASVDPAPSTAIPALRWDPQIAAYAQRWADSCPSGHRGDSPYGENIFWSGGSAVPPDAAVDAWASEAANYDYRTTVCARGGRANWAYCGHYTQLVWRDTQRVGCGMRTDCPGQFDTVIVCNFDPPGNVNAGDRTIPHPY